MLVEYLRELSILSKKLEGYIIGSYWNREENEIDIVALNKDKALFFECKNGNINHSNK